MIQHYKDNLMGLSKEQLIYLIEKLYDSQRLIGECCVEQSKLHISSDEAMEAIRGYIYDIPSMIDVTFLKDFIDMKMTKISIDEYRRVIGLE